MVSLSQDITQGPVCYKANEYLLSQAGFSTETSLRTLLKGLSRESATEKVNQVFIELYGQPIQPNIEIKISTLNKPEEEKG